MPYILYLSLIISFFCFFFCCNKAYYFPPRAIHVQFQMKLLLCATATTGCRQTICRINGLKQHNNTVYQQLL